VTHRLEVIAIGGLPEIGTGAPLGALVAEAAAAAELSLTSSDVVVISQKVVSKAEGRVRDLGSVTPGERAVRLAAELDKDPRLVELILAETREVIRSEGGVLIAETHGGWVCANAGVDSSNVPGEESVALLPEDGDASAARIRAEIGQASGAAPAVVIADSFGRPWRLGQTDVAIGCAGLVVLDDWEGRPDRESRPLAATNIAIADEVAATADLAREKDGGTPAVLLRGLDRYVTPDNGPGAAALRRAEAHDLFR
jgi:coenzyme F420-0:L-glutamate ligase/coenzyme F420-1:gamma-L-glutamate ligase